MAEVKTENFNTHPEEGKRENNRRPRDHNQHHNQHHKGQRQMGRGQGNENQWQRKDVVKERLEMMSGPTTNLVSKEGVSAKKFTGRCRLFVGNLPPTITDEEFRKMFEQFGEIAEVFLNPQKGFGFVKLVSKSHLCTFFVFFFFNYFYYVDIYVMRF